MADESPRSSRLPFWLLTLVVAGGAAALGIYRPDDPSKNGKPDVSVVAPDKSGESLATADPGNPLEVLRNHLHAAAKKKPPSNSIDVKISIKSNGKPSSLTYQSNDDSDSDGKLTKDDLLTDPAEYDVLIATLPDPVETKFPHDFDAGVDSIQRAFEAMEYQLRASWLPWPRERDRNNPRTKADPPHREKPGVLLFRKHAASKTDVPSICLVFLVGESPVSGIHKAALKIALEMRHEFKQVVQQAGTESNAPRKVKWRKGSTEVQIIAPHFSGTQESLIQVLEEYQNKKCDAEYRIISGSASKLSPQLFHRSHIPVPKTTVIPNDYLMKGVLGYLDDNRGLDIPEPRQPPDKKKNPRFLDKNVAILHEANTGFGAMKPNMKVDGPVDDALMLFPPEYLMLPFPLSISQLQVDQQSRNKAILPQTDFTERRLPVRDTIQLDVIPPYDAEAAKAIAGQSVRTILSTINRARIQYVGIIATDARDVVYLNRLLNKECPNVRIFTTEPSIALLHPEDAYHLRGIVVGSTYPLAAVTEYWTQPKKARRQMIPFPTQASHGYFNAVLAMFDKSEDMLGYRAPFLQNGLVKTVDRPPVWISVVGENGRLVPVHCFSEFKSHDPEMVSSKSEIAHCPTFFVPWMILLGSLGSVALLVLVILTLWRGDMWRLCACGLSDAERDHIKDANTSPRLKSAIWFWRSMLLVAVLLFALPYALPARELWDSYCGFRITSFHPAAVFLLSFVIISLTIGILIRLFTKSRWRFWTDDNQCGYFVMAIVVALGLSILGWSMSLTAVERFFLYVRAADLSAGLSPLVPMGLLGFSLLGLAWGNLVQADLARRWQHPESPFAAPVWDELAKDDRELRESFQSPFLARNGLRSYATWIGMGSLLLATVVLQWEIWLPTGEGNSWDVLMAGAFFGIAGLLVITLVRFLALWSRVDSFLKHILKVPMVGAFERLADPVRRLFRGYLSFDHDLHRIHLATLLRCLPTKDKLELVSQIQLNRPELVWLIGDSPVASLPADVDPKNTAEDLNAEARKFLENRAWLLKFFQARANRFIAALPQHWYAQHVEQTYGVDRPSANPASSAGLIDGGKAKEQEDFIAAYVVMMLGGYFAQLRMLVYAMIVAAPLLLFAAAAYPFQPERPRLFSLVALLFAVGASIAYVLYRINRNALISRIARTTPNLFTPDSGFFSSIAMYVLPVVSIALLQILGLFRTILEPVLSLFQ